MSDSYVWHYRLMNWSSFPYLRIALALSAGIFFFEYFALRGPAVIFCLCGVVILLVKSENSFKFNPDRKSLIAGCLLLLLFFLLGGTRLIQRNEALDNQRAILESADPVIIHGRVNERLKSGNRQKYSLGVDYLSRDGKTIIPCNTELIVVFDQEDSLSGKYQRGDFLYLKSATRRVRTNSNPLAFDYSYYLRTKGITLQAFVPTGQHRPDTVTQASDHLKAALSVSKFAQGVYARYLDNNEQKGTAESLMLGDRFLLTEKLYQAYSDTGAIHVLSVSGLHVAIFISIFIWIFSKIPDHTWSIKLAKLFALIAITWFYVILTGLGPSVTRSGIMVSLFLIGKTLSKNTSNYNILALSAVLMLLYEPMYLFQVSFQFSYISLLSILYFQPRIKRLYTSKNKVINFFWDLINVSFAAQIMIFPYTSYYFHQFPLYFALSGIVAVPLVTVIIYAGTLLVVAEFFLPVFNIALAPVFRFLIELLNTLITAIGDLPHAKLEDIWISQGGLVLMTLAILFLILWLEIRSLRVFYGLLSIIFLIIAESVLRSAYVSRQNDLVVYDVGGGAIVDAFENGFYRTYRVGAPDEANTKFAATNRRIWSACDPIFTLEGGGAFCFDGQMVYVAGNKADFDTLACTENVRLLVVSGFGYNRPEPLLTCLNPEIVVLDRNLPRRITEKWLLLQKNSSPFTLHNIKTDGAFSLSAHSNSSKPWEQ